MKLHDYKSPKHGDDVSGATRTSGPDGDGRRSDVFFIVGPTCSGKTDVAQWIAERGDFDILSADSMLVYKGLDIGTAKPGTDEQRKVRYWGIDLVEISESFSAGMYLKAAISALASAGSEGRDMIIAGGTGLYIRTLIDGLDKGAPADDEIRAEAEHLLRTEGVEALERRLKMENMALYESLPDKKNPRRLIRAMERARTCGETATARWRRANAGPLLPCLIYPPDQIIARIERRARYMFTAGLIEETQRLLDSGLESAPTARHAIGYMESIDFIRGRCSMEEAVQKTITRTRRLVKRQITWFRHQANVRWLFCDESMQTPEIAAMIREHWDKTGPTPIMPV